MAKETQQNTFGSCVIANDVAIAQVFMSIDSDFIDASGVARKHPDDKFSASVAEKLAYGRALESLGKKLQKRANGEVKQNEDNARRTPKPEAIPAKETTKRRRKK